LNNNQGFSFVETILTVAILILLFGTLLPLSNHMMVSLAEKKISLHIAITKNQAATSILNGGVSGVVHLNGIEYSWEWNSPTLCVNYEFIGESNESCGMY